MNKLILSEVSNSVLMIKSSAIPEVEMLLNAKKKEDIDQQKINIAVSGAALASDIEENPFKDFAPGTVLILPIIGVMLKYSDWWSYGIDYIADLLRQADSAENVAGTILLMNTPGGSTQSLIRIEEALRLRTKPCVAVVDGMCCSCGVYVASFADKVVATNRMCEIGSIGCYMRLRDDSKAMEQYGYKFIDVYPPESSYKNKGVREALDDKPQWLIDETLSPFAQHFQNIIRQNRPNLDEKVEGIIEGRDFYAYDAKANGLIDDIITLDAAVELVVSLSEDRKKLSTLFTN